MISKELASNIVRAYEEIDNAESIVANLEKKSGYTSIELTFNIGCDRRHHASVGGDLMMPVLKKYIAAKRALLKKLELNLRRSK